jgi:hypothetical protein
VLDDVFGLPWPHSLSMSLWLGFDGADIADRRKLV